MSAKLPKFRAPSTLGSPFSLSEPLTDAERQRNTRRWQRLSRRMRRLHPLCQDCGNELSVEVHHVEPISTAPQLAFSELNLRALCRACHHARHARERHPPGG